MEPSPSKASVVTDAMGLMTATPVGEHHGTHEPVMGCKVCMCVWGGGRVAFW